MTESLNVNRRRLLQGMVATSAVLAFPGFGIAEYPAQDVIDRDPLRPRYHLMPVRGWMNDPCAPLFFKGTYHLFFQYNPGASVWGDMHWAHAVSRDMVHWEHRPVALAPTPGGADAKGVFTGSVVLDKGLPTLLFTGIVESAPEEATEWGSHPPIKETQNLATPVDDTLDRWTKLPQPVIAAPPAGMKVTGFRDPTPWREADAWYLLLASGQKGVGGNVLLYKSPDLRHWEFQHIFAEGKPTGGNANDTVDSGETWECPDFFPLGDRHVLIHSVGSSEGRQTLWQSGRLDKTTMRWTAEQEGVLNQGPYYAPKTQLDAAGNRILWGWIPEERPEVEYARAGWAGCMSLPRVLTLEAGQVRFRPAGELVSLRGDEVQTPAQMEVTAIAKRVSAGSAKPGEPLRAGAVKIETGTTNGLLWLGKPIGLKEPLPDHFGVRCFVDHSVAEVFVGDRMVLTKRVYGEQDRAMLVLPAGFAVSESGRFGLSSI